MKIPLILFAVLLFISCSKKDNVVYYKLTTEVSPSNVGTIAPSDGVFEKGKHIQLTALPSAGYIFKEWQNSLSGSQNPVDIIMDSDKNITALFEKRNYPLNIEIAGEGVINEEVIIQKSQATNYPHGTVVRLTANPSSEWVFKGWEGDYIGNDNPITLTIEKLVNIKAVFQKIISLKINNPIDSLIISKKYKVNVTGVSDSGIEKDISDKIELTNDDKLATILSGEIIGAKSGKAIIKIKFGGIEKQISINITPIEEVTTIDNFLSSPANGYKVYIPVVVINYYPTLNGIDIDTKRAPSFGGLDPITIDQLKARTIDLLKMTKFGIEEGSKFRGYNNPTAIGDVGVKVIKYFNLYEIRKVKLDPGYKTYSPDFKDIFNKLNLKNIVNNLGAKEVWFSLRPLSPEYPIVTEQNLDPENFMNVWESDMSSPVTSDISNSDRSKDDLPIYTKSYVVYGYNLHRTYAENLHNRGHQIESQLSYIDLTPSKELFWNKFVGFTTTSSGYKPFGRNGMTEYPPNTVIAYDWDNSTLVETDIENWQPNGGTKLALNNKRWNDKKYNYPPLSTMTVQENDPQFKWLIYWFQSIPNSTNQIFFNGNKLENWWDLFYNWDDAVEKNKTLWERTNVGNSRIYIPDVNFEKALIQLGYDDVVDNYISSFNAERITSVMLILN